MQLIVKTGLPCKDVGVVCKGKDGIHIKIVPCYVVHTHDIGNILFFVFIISLHCLKPFKRLARVRTHLTERLTDISLQLSFAPYKVGNKHDCDSYYHKRYRYGIKHLFVPHIFLFYLF